MQRTHLSFITANVHVSAPTSPSPRSSLCTRVPLQTNNAAKNDEAASIPPEVMKQLGEMGAYGIQVPEVSLLLLFVCDAENVDSSSFRRRQCAMWQLRPAGNA